MRGNDNINFPGKDVIDEYKIPIKYIEYTKRFRQQNKEDLLYRVN